MNGIGLQCSTAQCLHGNIHGIIAAGKAFVADHDAECARISTPPFQPDTLHEIAVAQVLGQIIKVATTVPDGVRLVNRRGFPSIQNGGVISGVQITQMHPLHGSHRNLDSHRCLGGYNFAATGHKTAKLSLKVQFVFPQQLFSGGQGCMGAGVAVSTKVGIRAKDSIVEQPGACAAFTGKGLGLM